MDGAEVGRRYLEGAEVNAADGSPSASINLDGPAMPCEHLGGGGGGPGMMEFFMSKVWMFLVGIALMAVLLQGVQTTMLPRTGQRPTEDLAESLQDYFERIELAGPGLQVTIDLSGLLPSSVSLNVQEGYAELSCDGDTRKFSMPGAMLFQEKGDGGKERVDTMSVRSTDRLTLLNTDTGMVMTLLSPRTSPPRT